MLSFKGTLDPDGGAAIEVPPSVLSDLRPVGKRPTVVVTIRGMEVRTRIMVYSGRSYIGLRQAQRAAIGLSPGDSVQVEIALDSSPRSVEVPDDLAAALSHDPEAQRVFDQLSFTNRKEYVEWVTSAKRPATREERITRAPELLKSGRRTPLGR